MGWVKVTRGEFDIEAEVLPVRYWRGWWHWRRWSLTVYRGMDGVRCGTWMLCAGPLTVTRLWNG